MEFQSPLHRGNHFNEAVGLLVSLGIEFQSPLHRGNHFNVFPLDDGIHPHKISVPSSSGKSLQLLYSHDGRSRDANFSPLFIGEITSTEAWQKMIQRIVHFSPLFIGEITSTKN